MQSIAGNIAVLILTTLFVACGGGSGGTGSAVTGPPVNATPPPDTGTIGDGRLGELAEWARASQDVPAMAVVLVANGQISEMAAVGVRSNASDEIVTDADHWHIGSLTKGMTATLAGVLIEQSLIDWNTTPLDVWPELDASIHAGFRNVTLKQLLSHTSGMRGIDGVPIDYEDAAAGTPMEKRRVFAADLLAEPPAGPVGQDSYSNAGYIVAAAMLETATVTPWETLMAQQLFGPLGMLDSGFGAPGTPGTNDQPWGHWDRGLQVEPVPPGPGSDNPQTMAPAGAVHVSLHDYAQFMLAHIAGARGIDGLVTASTFDVLHTAVDNGSAPGWGVRSFEAWANGRVLSHAGSNLRWYAVVRIAAELDAGVLMVVNAGGGRAEAAIDSLGDLVLERFQASQ